MRARDIMTISVVTTRPDTSVREIAALLSKRQFSGLPVVDADGRLLGIVSEGDLIHHSTIGADPKGKVVARQPRGSRRDCACLF